MMMLQYHCDTIAFIIMQFHSPAPQLKGGLAQAVEVKFKIHLYHKVATALSPCLRSFLRKTLNTQEYEEVINTLAALMTTGTEQRVRVREGEEEGE